MPAWSEIKDLKEIATLNEQLHLKLRAALRHTEMRTIGTPGGSFIRKVRFQRSAGKDVFWWIGKLSKDGRSLHNNFGHGTPAALDPLTIDLQFNLPRKKFSRTRGGSFLRHDKTGIVMMAHRGIATLGHGRVKLDVLFENTDSSLLEANTSAGAKEFLPISNIDSPSLILDISRFSASVRRIVRGQGQRKTSRNGGGERPPVRRGAGLTELRAYFKEYSGQRKTLNPRTVVAECYHGDVVAALRRALDKYPEPLKSREIDLVGYKGKKAFLFEVKTSADTQSVYTAVGQLAVHGATAAKSLGKLPERAIVLPQRPIPRLHEILTTKLGIRFLTFTRSPKGRVTISGLEGLS